MEAQRAAPEGERQRLFLGEPIGPAELLQRQGQVSRELRGNWCVLGRRHDAEQLAAWHRLSCRRGRVRSFGIRNRRDWLEGRGRQDVACNTKDPNESRAPRSPPSVDEHSPSHRTRPPKTSLYQY